MKLQTAIFDNPRYLSYCFLVLSTSTIILFVRKTDALINPQFWAEDGAVFFIQQYHFGAWAIFEQYAGYFHLIPRLIAWFADVFFPYSVAPHVYNYSSLLITLVVIGNVFSSRLVIQHKTLLALAIVSVPHFTNDVFLNVTNLQWILALLILVTLLKKTPNNSQKSTLPALFIDLIIIVLCGFTGPFIILMSPFFIWKFFKNGKDHYTLIILITVLIVSSTQAYSIITHPIGNPVPQSDQSAYNLSPYIELVGYKLFGNLFLGVNIAYKINPCIYFFIFLSFTLFFSFLLNSLFHDKDRFFMIIVFLTFAFFIALTTAYKFKSNPSILIPAGNGLRYSYIPYVMVTWSLILCIEPNDKIKNIFTIFLLLAILKSSISSDFRSAPFKDFQWESYSKSIGKVDELNIPINPPGWYVKFGKKEKIER